MSGGGGPHAYLLGADSQVMAGPTDTALAAKIAELERELRELRARVAALERLVGAGSLHPSDQATVRQKVAYDWQG